MKCECEGCEQDAEFFAPPDNRLCSDCVQRDVETGEYSWDECEAIPRDFKGSRFTQPDPKAKG